MGLKRPAGKTGKPYAGKLARTVWSGGKVVKPYLSLQNYLTLPLGRTKHSGDLFTGYAAVGVEEA